MATLSKTINTISVPAELDTLQFRSDKVFDLIIDVAGVVIFSARLTPYAGKATVHNLADLILTALQYKTQNVNISTTDIVPGESITHTVSTRCLPFAVAFDMPLQDFLDKRFLTRANGVIDTYPGCIEKVSFYEDQNKSLSVVADFVTADNHVEHVTINSLSSYSADGYICTTDIYVHHIAAKKRDALLVAFTVNYDNIRQRFRVLQKQSDGMDIYFRNAFGCHEHVYFPFAETILTPKISVSRINGVEHNYKVDHHFVYNGEAQIQSAVVPVFEDLLLSKDVFRQSDNVPLRIESGEVSDNNDNTKTAKVKATWSLASNVLQHHIVQPTKTFDRTFDQTFE